MQNIYFSSTVVSLGGRGSISFSSNDCSHFLNERFQRHPLLGSSSSACCCSCCACSTPRVPINPSYLYGWRQSNLIQWSCSRRLVLGGGRSYFNGLDPGIYDVSCTVKRRNGDGRIGRTRCIALEDESERYGPADVEAMISLLSEDVGEECFRGRERSSWGSIRSVEMGSRGNYDRESYRRKKKSVGSSSLDSDSKCKIELREEINRQREERKSLSLGQSNSGRKKNVGLVTLESELKGRFESVNTALGEEDCRGSRKREDLFKDENRRMRKEGSTSSYYSFSSSGEFEGDMEAQAEHGGLMEESPSEFRKDSRTAEGTFNEEVEETHMDDSVEHGEASRQKHTAVVNGGEWDWRKNSEKKLAQVSVEEDQSRKESLHMDSRMTRINESDNGKTSSSRKQVKDEEEALTFVGSSKTGMHKQYRQSESRIKYQESGMEEKGNATITVGEHHKVVGTIAQKYDSRANTKQLNRMSEQQTVTESASNLRRQSETRMKNWEETSTSVPSSDRETEEQHHLKGERTTGQVGLRKKVHQGFTLMPEKASILQSGSRMKSQLQNSGVASSSGPEAGGQHSQTDQGVVRRSQSQKGSQDVITSSAHSGDSAYVLSSRSSEKRVTDQEINLTSTVTRVVETREKQSERVRQKESKTETGKHKISSFHENDSKEVTSSGASLTLVSPVRSQKIDMGKASSPARMMPPPAQLVSRGSFQVEPTSGIMCPDLDIEPYDGARRDETYGEPLIFVTNEDALGSAYRSQKFSTQYVGDFVEQARHEISTSEIQKEKKVSETMLVHEDESQALGQLKEHESKCTSEGSGTKGPSDEMWDVTDPSFQEPSNAEDPEVTAPPEIASGNALLRKSGRSLWNIIGDIARLRWGSQTGSPGSAVRSGAKSSPDESVGTEAWFSGREHEGSSDEKAEKKIVVPQEPTSYELQLGKSSSSEGEVSDTMRSKDKKRDTEAYISDPPIIVETGSAAISLTSGGENIGSNEDRKSFPVVESSLPLSGRDSRRSSSTGESSETGKTDVSRHGSLEQMEQPSSIRQTEVLGTEGKDGELKRRRLQRDKQIMKDSFDDWEEAYKHESEQRKIDEMFMREALLESKKAADAWEVPVGAVLVQNGTIIARGYNLVEELRDSTAHAEMICIREASNQLKTWRLADTTLYVTLEPCPMCAGAILQARIDTLVWGAPNKLLGADGSWVRLFPNGGEPGDKPAGPVHPFHPNMKIRRGVLAAECADAMQQFFQLRRKKARNPDLPTPSSTLAAGRHPSKFISKMQQMFHIMFCL